MKKVPWADNVEVDRIDVCDQPARRVADEVWLSLSGEGITREAGVKLV